MSLLATVPVPTGGFLGSTSLAALGMEIAALAVAAPGSTSWPSANLAMFVPFALAQDALVTRAGWVNGSVIGGNCDVGVYDLNGQRLVATGSTAAAGAVNSYQLALVTPTFLAGPGVYYLAMASNAGGSQTLRRFPANVELLKACGMAEMANAFPLPATATFTGLTNSYLPMVGLSFAPV